MGLACWTVRCHQRMHTRHFPTEKPWGSKRKSARTPLTISEHKSAHLHMKGAPDSRIKGTVQDWDKAKEMQFWPTPEISEPQDWENHYSNRVWLTSTTLFTKRVDHPIAFFVVNYDTWTLCFAPPYLCRTRHSANRTWDPCRILVQTLKRQRWKKLGRCVLFSSSFIIILIDR